MAEEEPLEGGSSTGTGSKQTEIRVAKVGSISVYEITEGELRDLEKGSHGSIFLNFGLSLLSIGASFLVTLLAVTIASIQVFTVFVVFTVVSFIASVVLLFLWRHDKRNVDQITQKIKSRMIHRNPAREAENESD